MSRRKDYQALLNSKRWKSLRVAYLREHPLCERCFKEGRVTSAIDVHHKKPVEDVTVRQAMESRCFDWTNLEALCIPCHLQVHQQMRSHTRQAHQQRASQEAIRWLERVKGTTENPAAPV